MRAEDIGEIAGSPLVQTPKANDSAVPNPVEKEKFRRAIAHGGPLDLEARCILLP